MKNVIMALLAGIVIGVLFCLCFRPAIGAPNEYAQTGDYQIICHPYSMKGTYLLDTKTGRSWILAEKAEGLGWTRINDPRLGGQ